MMELKKKKSWLSLNAENQLSGFLCLEKIGKWELLRLANVVVDGNADRLVLLGATVGRSQSILDVLYELLLIYMLCLVDLVTYK